MKFPHFGKNKYNESKVSPVPEGQEQKQNGVFINEGARHVVVHIYDCGRPDDIAVALGNLEIAKDVVKQTFSDWHSKDVRRAAIIVPKINGH